MISFYIFLNWLTLKILSKSVNGKKNMAADDNNVFSQSNFWCCLKWTLTESNLVNFL
jgi:hypothetical protein